MRREGKLRRSKAPFVFKPSPGNATAMRVNGLRPLQLNRGDNHLGFSQLQVFADDRERIVLSLASSRGTLSVGMTRAIAAKLASTLVKHLV
jgi:hypothetical protein